jgi:hypothetical protein
LFDFRASANTALIMISAWASVMVVMRGPIALLSGNLDIYTTNMSVYLARTKKTAYVVRRRGVAQPGSAMAYPRDISYSKTNK